VSEVKKKGIMDFSGELPGKHPTGKMRRQSII
jgi:hypothetical protein